MDFFMPNMANLLHCSSIGFGKDLIKTGLISSFMKPLSGPKFGLGCFNIFQKKIINDQRHYKPGSCNENRYSLCPHSYRENLLSFCLHCREPVFKTGSSLHAPCSTLYRIAVQCMILSFFL